MRRKESTGQSGRGNEVQYVYSGNLDELKYITISDQSKRVTPIIVFQCGDEHDESDTGEDILEDVYNDVAGKIKNIPFVVVPKNVSVFVAE